MSTYSDEQLAVVAWLNPQKHKKTQARALETLSSDNSSLPMAFPLESLLRNVNFSSAVVAFSDDEVYFFLAKSSRARPVIIPIPIARSSLGWDHFYTLSDYTEKV